MSISGLTSVHHGAGVAEIGGIVPIPFTILGSIVHGAGVAVGAILTGGGMILFGTPDLIAVIIHGGGILGAVAVTGQATMPVIGTDAGQEVVTEMLGMVAEAGIAEHTDRVALSIPTPTINAGIIPVAEAVAVHGIRVTETSTATIIG